MPNLILAMSTYKRYKLLKRLNPNCLIILKDSNRYIAFEKDLQILEYLKFNFEYRNCNLNYLDKYSVNYIILDNLDIVCERRRINNNYRKLLKQSYLCEILKKIGNY